MITQLEIFNEPSDKYHLKTKKSFQMLTYINSPKMV